MQIYLHDLGIENSLTKTGNETLRPKVQSFYGEGNYVIVYLIAKMLEVNK